MESAIKRGMLLKSVQEESGESKVVTYNACKSISNGPRIARRILDADFSFTYNTAGEDFLRMARERLEMLANGKDSTRNDMQALDVMESAYTSPILPEEELNDESKFHKLRIPLRICILGVDGLEHEALNEYSKLTCRLHLMDEFGKPQAPPKKPTFTGSDRKRYPHYAQLPSIGVMDSPDHGGYSFRARYDEKTLAKLELDIYQTFAYPRWKGKLSVEFSIPNPKYLKQLKSPGEEEKEEVENMEREIVVAKFEIPYTSFNDGRTVKFCTPKKLPDDKDAEWDFFKPAPITSRDSDARLYLKMHNRFEEKEDADINYNLMRFFDANVAYMNESRDLCVGNCKPCDEFKRLEWKDTVTEDARQIVRQRTVDGFRYGMMMTHELEQLIRMSSEYLEQGKKKLDNLLLRRFEVATIVLKVRHMRFWAEHAPEKFFCDKSNESDKPSKDYGWQSFTDEVRAAFMTEAYESYCDQRLRDDLESMYVVVFERIEFENIFDSPSLNVFQSCLYNTNDSKHEHITHLVSLEHQQRLNTGTRMPRKISVRRNRKIIIS